jgi:divalent metal cation (Fe/Co/Zn/Cd) transporter
MAESASGTGALATAISEAQRAQLIQEAFRLECFTIAWMLIEAAVAIAAGLVARSVALLAFGLDSVIELVSTGC